MPRELEFEGILFPTLLAIFFVAAVAYWLLNTLLARTGFYQWVWHTSLFRVCLFVCLFSTLGLLVYR